MATWNVNAALSALNSNARRKSSGYCARYVRTAIEAGGVSTAGRPGSAYLYTSYLPKIGFGFVTRIFGREAQAQWSASSAQPGDIAVMSHGKHGHICMWNGRQWISDFFQNNMWVYSNPWNSNVDLFRWNGVMDNSFKYTPPPVYQSTSGLPGTTSANAYSPASSNPLTGSSDIYGNNNAGDEEHTRIYQAFAPSLLLDEMTLNSDDLESRDNNQ